MVERLPVNVDSPLPVRLTEQPLSRRQERTVMAALNMGGTEQTTISLFTGRHRNTVRRWICRVDADSSIDDRPRSGRPRRFQDNVRLRTIAVYCQLSPPLPGVSAWSLRDAENHFRQDTGAVGMPVSRSSIRRILLEHSLRPHRREYYLQITDPEFFPKMERIIQCYMNMPEHLYCFDECTCIQALKPVSPDLPAKSQQAYVRDFDYKRNGTRDLMAFLHPASGTVSGECTAKHDTATLCEVFSRHVEALPDNARIHYIMDNLTPHYHDDFCRTVADLSNVNYQPLKTGEQRRAWLESEHKRIVIHFLPFHASWLNMIEIWFGILNAKCLKPGCFESVQHLSDSIHAFIDTWNSHLAHPFTWSYTGEGLQAKAVRRFSRLLEIETPQMDSKFLTSQLLLMCNIAQDYLRDIPAADWSRLIELAYQKTDYIRGIIEFEPGPYRKRKAESALEKFNEIIILPQRISQCGMRQMGLKTR
ncbi:IS630 family transposase [Thioalkalivibrio sp.]|uniref:IS630 family transposase n=1 Tax=Thioalkalivibrio sp. TaxID=2093813 RepID=UPI0039757F69